jgi:glycosyltransferase involved in cell wall biosynthesis
MRIAQVAPLYESVPPRQYGGTERVVSYLTEELVRQGHEVTLFASGDSVTQARLIPGSPKSLRTDPNCVDPFACHFGMLEQVYQRAMHFDVVHFHIDYLHFPVSSRKRFPHLTTLHGRLDIPGLASLYQHFPHEPVVSISDAQRKPLSQANWTGTVYHGLPEEIYRCYPEPGKYLAFIGRISPEKRADRAVEIAQRVGLPLKIAAKVDRADREYFYEQIEPLLDHPLVEFVGEIGEREKNAFLGNAYALLFPIDWPEPFGLVMIEALACGLPVIAWRCGSVSEVIDDGVTGFVVDNIADAVKAVERIPELSRTRCREVFETRFSDHRMSHDYLRIYRHLHRLEMEQARANLTVLATGGADVTDGDGKAAVGIGNLLAR